MSAILCEISPVIYLHRARIVAREPCSEGLAAFDEYVKLQGRKSSLRLELPHLFWIASNPETRAFYRWAVEWGLLPRISAPGADLCGADLCGANLCGADLCGADLCGADLRGANLRGANLRGADLCGADLRGANLRGANLRGADLCGADLCGATRWSSDHEITGWTYRNSILVPAETAQAADAASAAKAVEQ